MKASKQANPPEILRKSSTFWGLRRQQLQKARPLLLWMGEEAGGALKLQVDGRGGRGRSQTPSGWERRQGALSNSKWMGEEAGGALKLQVDGRGGRGRSQTPSGWERRQAALSNSKWMGEEAGGALKLQALVYNILPSTTAVFSYATGSRKLSANEQFFVGAQTVVSLLQTTQIKQGVSITAINKVNTSTNKTTII